MVSAPLKIIFIIMYISVAYLVGCSPYYSPLYYDDARCCRILV